MFVERIGDRVVVSAGPQDPSEIFSGLRQTDGEFLTVEALEDEVGPLDLFEVVYNAPDPIAARLLRIIMARLRMPEDAAQLFDILRQQPLDGDVERLTLPPELDAGEMFAERFIVVGQTADGAQPSSGLSATVLVSVESNVMLQVLVLNVSMLMPDDALGETVVQTAKQRQRIAAAEEGTLLPALERPFPVLSLVDVADAIPGRVEGFGLTNLTLSPPGASGEGEEAAQQLTAQYVGAGGDFVLLVLFPLTSASEAVVQDYLLRLPGALTEPFADGAVLRILETEPLSSPPVGVAAAERWQVDLSGTVLFDDVVSFRHGAVWGIIQGLSASAVGEAPVEAVLDALREAIDAALSSVTP